MGKASEAGFGNEMYKVLTAAALSVMLNRSLIIGQTRHIGSFLILSALTFSLACLFQQNYFSLRFILHLYISHLFM